MRVRHLALVLLVCLGASGCAGSTGTSRCTADAYPGPGTLEGQPSPPSATVAPHVTTAPLTPTSPVAGAIAPSRDEVPALESVVDALAGGWTHFACVNQVRDITFDADGGLWAASTGGLVHWNLGSKEYTRYPLFARAVAPSPDGAIWMAMADGLCRFDGVVCETWSNQALLGPLLALAVMPDGTLWAGGEGGVSRLSGRSWTHYPSAVATLDLATGANGEVWAATSGGVGRYLPTSDTWLTYTEEDGLPGRQATSVAVAPDGAVWVDIAWAGIYRFDDGHWVAAGDPPGGLVGDITFAQNGRPWVGTIGSLHYPGGTLSTWNGSDWVDVLAGSRLDSIGAVAPGPENAIAAANSQGLVIYEEGQWQILRDGPLAEHVTASAITPDGSTWFAFGDHSVSTPGGGLSQFDGKRWHYHLDGAEITALAVAPDGALWAGSGCSLQRFDGSSWSTVVQCDAGLPPGAVLDIAFAPSGIAWVATGMNLASFDGSTWTAHDKLAYSVLTAPGGAVWIQAWDGTPGSDYVARLDPLADTGSPTEDHWTVYPITATDPGGFRIAAVAEDSRVWGLVGGRGLASFDGLGRPGSGSWTFHDSPGDHPLDSSRQLTIAPDGSLWVYSDSVLIRLELATLGTEGTQANGRTMYTLPPGLGDPSDQPIAVGPGGEVWVGAYHLDFAAAGGE